MENLLTEGAAVNLDDSVFFNLSIRFPSSLCRGWGVCYEWEGKNCKKREICKQHAVFCKSFLYRVMTHLRNTVVFNVYLYMQLETVAVFPH